MTPSPVPRSASGHEHAPAVRYRQLRNPNPYDATNSATPPQVPPLSPHAATPGVYEGGGQQLMPDESSGDEDIDLEDGDGDGDGVVDGEDEELDDEGNGGEDEEGGIEEVPMDIETPFDVAALGLKEIGNLASWTVSSCKPGCGVEALRDEDTNLFWQSDGPQPHHLNIHFSRLVSILSIRIYLDFESDESYTPTRITLLAGTGYHDLIPFSSLDFAQPKGWIDVPLEHVGGGEDGKTLRAFLVQVKIVENHQNGKDTHVRGLKVYARDERITQSALTSIRDAEQGSESKPSKTAAQSWLLEPAWMGEAELR